MADARQREYREAADLLCARGNAVALTGAGISVESGIPAFRGTQGMWETYDPMEYATIGAFLRNPEKVWTMFSEMLAVLSRAVPSPAHFALADLEGARIVRSVITQNVDGLHQAAGSRRVIEFHGNAVELVCISCGNRYRLREKVAEAMPPRCACSRILKPDLVLFGEPIPWNAQQDAETEAERASVLLVIGTSAQVSPACDIPRISREKGAAIVEINPEKTEITRSLATVHIRERAGKALSEILSEIGKIRQDVPVREE